MTKLISLKYKLILSFTLLTLVTLTGFYIIASSLFTDDKMAYLYSRALQSSKQFEKEIESQITRQFLSLESINGKNDRGLEHIVQLKALGVKYFRSPVVNYGTPPTWAQGEMSYNPKRNMVFVKRKEIQAVFPLQINLDNELKALKGGKESQFFLDINKLASLKSDISTKLWSNIFSKGLHSGVKLIVLNENEYLVAFQKIFPGFYFLNFIDKTSALKGIDNLKRQFLYYALILFSISGIFSIIISNRISTPLTMLSELAEKFGQGDFKVRSSIQGRDEIGLLGSSFNAMADKIEKLVDEVKTYNTQLEEIVAKRTRSLNKAVKIQKAMMESLGQGFFMINKNLKLMNVYSKSASEFFEADLSKTNASDLLNVDNKGSKEMVLKHMFAETMPFEDTVMLAPQKFETSDKRKIFLEYKAVRNKKNDLSGVVVISTDKTEEVLAIEESERQKRKVQMIIKITTQKRQFQKLLEKTLEMVNRLKELCEFESIEDYKDEVFRIVHTIKGNLSTFYIMDVVNQLHEYESLLKDLPKNDLRPDLVLTFIDELDQSLQKFVRDHQVLLGLDDWKSVKATREVSDEQLTKLFEELKQKGFDTPQIESIKAWFESERPARMFSLLNGEIIEHSKRVGKEVNKLQVIDNGLRIKTSFLHDFQFYAIHLLRNSIDHGIESPSAREESGKERAGNIELSFEQLGGDLVITFKDDGRGIDSQDLLKRAVAMNLELNDQQRESPQNLIFHPGFSSSDSVSQTSGRGVGMDAVKEFIRSIGGEIEVSSKIGEYCCFSIKIFNFFS